MRSTEMLVRDTLPSPRRMHCAARRLGLVEVVRRQDDRLAERAQILDRRPAAAPALGVDPLALSAAQKEIYDRINATFVPWSDSIHFQSKTDDGRVVGPFNPILYSPGISSGFLDLHDAEEKLTSLDERVRQVVILSVGSVWKSDYELYAHSAAARKAGISENAIRALATGGLPDDLSEQEKVAQRYARQFSAEHRVDADLYSAAVHAFGEHGVVDLTYLIGIYHITCGLLNSFDIPGP